MLRLTRLLKKAAQTLIRDPRLALFLVRRRIWPLWYPVLRRFDKDPSGRGLFVDCGSNYGQGIDYFSALYPPQDYDYILIEPNPACQGALTDAASRLSSLGAVVDVKPMAAWDCEETLRLDLPPLSDDPDSLGASIVTQHSGGTSTEVATLDLGQLLESSTAAYSHFVLKMDIEGAELRVLPRVFDVLGSTRKPAMVYLELHSYYREGEAKQTALRAEKALMDRRPSNLKIREWH